MVDFHDLLILMVVVWTAGKIFRIFRLPVVFGELLGGIVIGPAMLNIIHVDSGVISILAELGIFFLMLHSGLETDHSELLGCSLKSLIVAISGIIFPLFGGIMTALYFGQSLESALLIGVGLSVSAISIKARLFKDCKIQHTEIAHVSLGASIVGDIVALILFSLVLNIAETGVIDWPNLIALLVKVSLFFAVVIFGGIRSAGFLNRFIYFGNKAFTLTLIIALIMGLIAEAIGLHMIIGAFLAGLFMNSEVIDKKTFDKIEDRVYGLSYSFFGPIFFASLAFYIDFTALKSAPIFLGAILVVAIFSKLIGCGVVAKLLGYSTDESVIAGFAMNSRGEVELIIASIGLEKGIINQDVFSILVVMALVSTIVSIVGVTPFAKKLLR